MLGKHIKINEKLKGSAKINKCHLADISEIIRLHPETARVYFCIIANSNRNGELITNLKSLSKLTGVENVNDTIINLLEDGFIDLYEVEFVGVERTNTKNILENNDDIEISGKIRIIPEKLEQKLGVKRINLHNTYYKFVLNNAIIESEDEESNSDLLIHISGNMFYDSNVKEVTNGNK